jgi:hypothetical protein
VCASVEIEALRSSTDGEVSVFRRYGSEEDCAVDITGLGGDLGGGAGAGSGAGSGSDAIVEIKLTLERLLRPNSCDSRRDGCLISNGEDKTGGLISSCCCIDGSLLATLELL